MDIKTFVAESLSQISSGIVEAQKITSSQGTVINPPLTTTQNGYRINLGNRDNIIAHLVDFDINVSVEDSAGAGGKGGIRIAMFGIEGGATSTNKNASTSRIKFSIPVCWPLTRVPEQYGGEVVEQPESRGGDWR